MYLYCLDFDVKVTIMWIKFEKKEKEKSKIHKRSHLAPILTSTIASLWHPCSFPWLGTWDICYNLLIKYKNTQVKRLTYFLFKGRRRRFKGNHGLLWTVPIPEEKATYINDPYNIHGHTYLFIDTVLTYWKRKWQSNKATWFFLYTILFLLPSVII